MSIAPAPQVEIQLPELPQIQRYEPTGWGSHGIREASDGDYVEYDDHVAAMHAYAQAALNARAGGDGWIAVTDRLPPEDVPVWCSINGGEPWQGAYCYAEGDEDGSGWAWMRCDSHPYLLKGEWKCDDIEWDDQYDVTHWQPLPTPPAALTEEAK